MDLETTTTLLSQARELADTDELKALVSDLETFIETQQAHNKAPEDTKLGEMCIAAREKLLKNFEEVVASHGITPAFLKKQLESPTLFSGKHQEMYEKIHNAHKGEG